MSELSKLTNLCKGISVFINNHKIAEVSILEYLKENDNEVDRTPEVDIDILQKMVEHDSIVEIGFSFQNYQDVLVYHYDIDLAVQRCLEIIEYQK